MEGSHRAQSQKQRRGTQQRGHLFLVSCSQPPSPQHHAEARCPLPGPGVGGTLKKAATAAEAKCSRHMAGDPLTFSQSVLEVGVTPSLAVEVNAVPDEESPAYTSGDSAIPTHHLFWTAQQL